MINLSALKENIDLEIEASKKESPDTFRCGMLLAEIVSEALEQQIASDVVEVVRCKDCIYSFMSITGKTVLYCDMRPSDDHLNLDKDYYCADGERREK